MGPNIILTLFYFSLLISALPPLKAQDRITGYNFAPRSEVIAKNSIATTSHPLATQVA